MSPTDAGLPDADEEEDMDQILPVLPPIFNLTPPFPPSALDDLNRPGVGEFVDLAPAMPPVWPSLPQSLYMPLYVIIYIICHCM